MKNLQKEGMCKLQIIEGRVIDTFDRSVKQKDQPKSSIGR